MQELSKSLQWFKVLGIILIAVGVFSILVPVIPGLAVVFLIGLALIISGVSHIVHAIPTRNWKGVFFGILSGIIFLLAGVILLDKPGKGLMFFTLVFAMLIFMEGIFEIFTYFHLPSESRRGWVLFSGIVAIFLATLIWRQWPWSSAWFLGTIIGVTMIFKGWALVSLANTGFPAEINK